MMPLYRDKSNLCKICDKEVAENIASETTETGSLEHETLVEELLEDFIYCRECHFENIGND